MSKNIKTYLSILLIILLLININHVFATENDLEYDTNIEDSLDTGDIVVENSTEPSSLSVLSPSTGTSVSSINSYEQANLHLNNVLCIILISIGLLLILLSIAILIRIGNKNNN